MKDESERMGKKLYSTFLFLLQLFTRRQQEEFELKRYRDEQFAAQLRVDDSVGFFFISSRV